MKYNKKGYENIIFQNYQRVFNINQKNLKENSFSKYF